MSSQTYVIWLLKSKAISVKLFYLVYTYTKVHICRLTKNNIPGPDNTFTKGKDITASNLNANRT